MEGHFSARAPLGPTVVCITLKALESSCADAHSLQRLEALQGQTGRVDRGLCLASLTASAGSMGVFFLLPVLHEPFRDRDSGLVAFWRGGSKTQGSGSALQ